MPRDTRTISLFLASPSDVDPERSIVSLSIDEWNAVRGRGRATIFELLKWETAVAAGFASDGQQVINAEIGEEYDALIMLIWGRIGTATNRALSGSLEEYERAFSRLKKANDVEISVFFKDAPVEIRTADLEQLQGVKDFQERLKNDGSLFKFFRDESSLRFEIALLLDKLARRFGVGLALDNLEASTFEGDAESALHLLRSTSLIPVRDNSSKNNVVIEETDHQFGIFDVIESLEYNSVEAGKVIDKMGNQLSLMTQANTDALEGIAELGKLGKLTPLSTKPYIDMVVTNMDSFSDFFEEVSGNYALHTKGLAEDTRMLIDLSGDFSSSPEEMQQLNAILSSLADAMEYSIENMGRLSQTLDGLPRMTTSLNKAKRRLSTNVQAHVADTRLAQDIVKEGMRELQAQRRN